MTCYIVFVRSIHREHADGILCLVLFKTDDPVVTGSKDRTFKMMNVATGDVLHMKKEHNGPVTCLALNTANSLLASGTGQDHY